ncbi:MAG: hypothetical protein O2923_07630 [Verrucomicrobia bacterium]|nr:hypothetical protein [Verrucomicrobiota bacterium]
MQQTMGLAGFPYDIYELHDLAKPDFPGDQYKLIVFLNCAMITETAAAGIARWQNGNRVLCWTYAAGITDYDGIRPDRHAALIGMRLGWRNQRQNIHVCVEDTGHPLTQGGAALNFGTEGSVGPVCFADDAQATVLGRLRDGGEAAFALHERRRGLRKSLPALPAHRHAGTETHRPALPRPTHGPVIRRAKRGSRFAADFRRECRI